MKLPNKDQIQQLLQAINFSSPFGERDHAMITLALHTGLRVSELAGLVVHHVATGGQPRQVLFLPSFLGKGGKERTIPFNATARQAVANLLAFNKKRGFSTAPAAPLLVNKKHLPLKARCIQRIVQQLREKADLDVPVTPHSFRHCFGTAVVENTGNIRSTQALLGHARLNSTQIYTRVSFEALAKAVKAIG